MPHTTAPESTTPNAFVELGLASQLTDILAAQGFNTPTPIQAASIPELLAGNDIMASAQTGTGKTAAFLLPALHRLTKEAKHTARGPRILAEAAAMSGAAHLLSFTGTDTIPAIDFLEDYYNANSDLELVGGSHIRNK